MEVRTLMTQTDLTAALAHYGVKGMKWGEHLPHVLAQMRDSVKKTFTKTRTVSTDYAAQRSSKGKSVDQMSTKELQDFVTRRNWEKKYKEMQAEERPFVVKAIERALRAGSATTVSELLDSKLGEKRPIEKKRIIDDAIKAFFDAKADSKKKKKGK